MLELDPVSFAGLKDKIKKHYAGTASVYSLGKTLAFNKGESWVDFIPPTPPPVEKLIHFDCCRRTSEKKLLWQSAESLHLLNGHAVLSPHQQLLIL